MPKRGGFGGVTVRRDDGRSCAAALGVGVLAGVLAGMEKQMLLSALFAGRSVKYLVFGVIASASPGTFKSLIAVIFMIEKPKEKAN